MFLTLLYIRYFGPENNLDNLDPDLNLFDNHINSQNCNYITTREFCDASMDPNHFSILNYNIRSFHKNGLVFESLLNSLNHPFKCLVISETWNNDTNLQLCKINSYDGFHTFRPQNHVYTVSGGISIFCKNGYNSLKTNPFPFAQKIWKHVLSI